MSAQGLKDRIKTDMVNAMREQNKACLSIIRMLQAAIKQKEVDERIDLDDAGVVSIIEKMIKQRKEAAKQFELGARLDLAQKELSEVEFLLQYMPAALSEAELEALIQASIQQVGASSIKDMGKVMGVMKDQVQGRADMALVGQLIKSRLS
jgi:hypothetical protein